MGVLLFEEIREVLVGPLSEFSRESCYKRTRLVTPQLLWLPVGDVISPFYTCSHHCDAICHKVLIRVKFDVDANALNLQNYE